MNRILFLCTGNYYRSRFGEEYFNFHAAQLGLDWLAESRGIQRDFANNGNVGPMAAQTLAELSRLGIDALGRERMPHHLEEADLAAFDRIIAVSRAEHQPMLAALWPEKLERVNYFDVEDLHLESFTTALPRLRGHLDQLLAQLVKARQDLPLSQF